MKERVVQFFNRHGITFVMVVLFALLVFVPFFILAAAAGTFFVNNTVETLSDTTMDTMTITAYEIKTSVQGYEEDSMILYNTGYVDLLEKGSALSGEDEELVQSALTSCSLSDTGIHSVYLVTDAQTLMAGKTYNNLLEAVEPWEEEIVAAGGKCVWIPVTNLYGDASELEYILARSLNSAQEENVGILYLVIDESLVSGPFENLTTDYSMKYLITGDGTTLYALNGEPSQAAEQYAAALTDTAASGFEITGTGASKTVFVYARIRQTDWLCVSEIPVDAIIGSMSDVVALFAAVCVLYVLVLALMLYLLHRFIFRPLRTLKGSMDQYAQDSLEVQSIEPVGLGEVRTLSDHFNRMTARIAQLMADYKAEVEETAREKIRTMSAQLTPHFVYNALNTIKWMAVLNHQEKIQELTESLIYIFMNAARAEDENYCVRDELELIRNYAVIQKARFMNFDLEIEADDTILDCRLRKLMLQPVVENAIVHGLGRGKIRDAKIRVHAWPEEGDLKITVTDEGVGFDVEAWRRRPDTGRDHTNIGLHNVEQIIELEYGAPYGMTIESEPGKGTCVTYRLPAIHIEVQ